MEHTLTAEQMRLTLELHGWQEVTTRSYPQQQRGERVMTMWEGLIHRPTSLMAYVGGFGRIMLVRDTIPLCEEARLPDAKLVRIYKYMVAHDELVAR